MKIGLMSDTHGFLDPKVFEHFEKVDEIWHAGDFGTMDLADELENFKPVKGVYGNIDAAKLRLKYPENLRFNCNGIDVYMTHIGGYPPKYNSRTRPLLRENPPGLFISGHSHILKIIPDPSLKLLHINPGACGNAGWHKIKTLVRFEIKNSRINNLEVIEIGRRGKAPVS